MELIDISQELFSSMVYPGDCPPTCKRVREIANGDLYNLTELSLSAHNGTHLDAPLHFLADGKDIAQMSLARCIGPCTVAELPADPDAIKALLQYAKPRLLLKNMPALTEETAALLGAHLLLLGTEAISVGSLAVHKQLLQRDVAILEGLVLSHVAPGDYTLIAPPLKLDSSDGAPCRAVLIKEPEVSYAG